MGLDVDKFGHCVKCHKNMIVEQVIGQKVVERFTPEYDETEYLLNDGSKMRVAICKTCKSKITDKDKDMVMVCVINGWDEEVKGIKHWDAAKKKNFMGIYSKKRIVVQSEGMPIDILDKYLEDYNKKEVKKNGNSK